MIDKAALTQRRFLYQAEIHPDGDKYSVSVRPLLVVDVGHEEIIYTVGRETKAEKVNYPSIN